MKLVSAKPNRATFGKKKLSLFLELEYLAVYGRTSAEGGGVDWVSDMILSWTDRNVTTQVTPRSVREA